MKKLLISAFTVRRRLISSGRSQIPDSWAQEQMKKIEFWLSTGNALNIARKNEIVLRVLIPGNFIKRFEKILNETK